MSVESSPLAEPSSLVPGAKLGRVSLLLRCLQALGLVVAILGFLKLRSAAFDVPLVIGFTADNRAIAGDTKPFQMTDERFLVFARDVVEGALTRNGKGLVPELKSYATEPCLTKLQEQYQRSQTQSGSFVQIYTIDAEDGIRLGSGNVFSAEALIRGIQMTRAIGKNVEARFYWRAMFVRGRMTPANPLGWYLNDLLEISESEYYKVDRAKAAADAVKLSPNKNR